MSDDEFETSDDAAFWFSGVGGLSPSGFNETWSPNCGGLLPELIAACVLGLSTVPRTVLECGFDMMTCVWNGIQGSDVVREEGTKNQL